MTYDIKDTCDGWATDLKLKVIISFDSGEARTFETSQVSWEAKSGKSFRFMTKSGGGGGGDDQNSQTRGEARIDSSGKGSVTAISRSKPRRSCPRDPVPGRPDRPGAEAGGGG